MNLHPQYLTTPQGERIAVQLSLEAYEELLEDLEDLAALVERQNEPALDYDEVLAELKADGLLSFED
ncbi:MAG: hypothetical protein IPL59_15960 [Candidatus Competibacteraceae bacterium]|uniref:CopG family transcriptional regulator n=1 Tax=Candidatus Contendobacter odensis Run_B_J11 TaxID=1400861 RepID=A0A7U7GC41_9GAMM|nr:hypothetical protein [Candidatus Contendobacter odensis]MBK8536480.1 hypothetical protein [Candidatus Competibacteraceae bacterium]MBK8754621.1 hypothetical protein [Candidatus Competibacteraceae bacterium]CDH45684.1 conserved hypothetical protein [Candidatus Contendobacter odensis Run_B_J11]